nr:hypothetical protein [Mucilaginibacter sp. X4EP1]
MRKALTKFNTSRNYARAIIFCLLFIILMFGANFNRLSIPYPVFIFLQIVCATIGVLSYAAYIYWKTRNWKKDVYNILYNLIAFFLLGLLVFIIVGFSVLVISNKN